MDSSEVVFNQERKIYEVTAEDGNFWTYFVFPAALEKGDSLPTLYIHALGKDFRFEGEYNESSDNLEFFIEGPVGFVYKASLQVDLPEEPYAWKIKRHAHTQIGRERDCTQLYVPRTICLRSPSLVTSEREVLKRWSFYGPTVPDHFGRLRLKVSLAQSKCKENPEEYNLRQSPTLLERIKQVSQAQEKNLADFYAGKIAPMTAEKSSLKSTAKEWPISHKPPEKKDSEKTPPPVKEEENLPETSEGMRSEERSTKIGEATTTGTTAKSSETASPHVVLEDSEGGGGQDREKMQEKKEAPAPFISLALKNIQLPKVQGDASGDFNEGAAALQSCLFGACLDQHGVTFSEDSFQLSNLAPEQWDFDGLFEEKSGTKHHYATCEVDSDLEEPCGCGGLFQKVDELYNGPPCQDKNCGRNSVKKRALQFSTSLPNEVKDLLPCRRNELRRKFEKPKRATAPLADFGRKNQIKSPSVLVSDQGDVVSKSESGGIMELANSDPPDIQSEKNPSTLIGTKDKAAGAIHRAIMLFSDSSVATPSLASPSTTFTTAKASSNQSATSTPIPPSQRESSLLDSDLRSSWSSSMPILDTQSSGESSVPFGDRSKKLRKSALAPSSPVSPRVTKNYNQRFTFSQHRVEFKQDPLSVYLDALATQGCAELNALMIPANSNVSASPIVDRVSYTVEDACSNGQMVKCQSNSSDDVCVHLHIPKIRNLEAPGTVLAIKDAPLIVCSK